MGLLRLADLQLSLDRMAASNAAPLIEQGITPVKHRLRQYVILLRRSQTLWEARANVKHCEQALRGAERLYQISPSPATTEGVALFKARIADCMENMIELLQPGAFSHALWRGSDSGYRASHDPRGIHSRCQRRRRARSVGRALDRRGG